jgi:heme A synthase
VVRQLQIWSTVLLGVAIGQAGLGSGFGASLIARDKSEALEAIHRFNAWLVIVVAAVCVVVALLYRRQGGPAWPLVFAACLLGAGVVQAVLGTVRVVGVHLFVGVLFLCAVTTFCSYAWRHQPSEVPVRR